VTTIRGNPTVGFLKGALNAGSDGFLAVVQMAKASNVACLVFVVAGNFHASHRVHELEHAQEFVLGAFYRLTGLVIQVVHFETAFQVETGRATAAVAAREQAPRQRQRLDRRWRRRSHGCSKGRHGRQGGASDGAAKSAAA